MKKIITLLLAVILLLGILILPACNRESEDTGPVAVTDFDGNAINLDRPAERVISFGAADTSIIVDIGAADRLVARTEWDTQSAIRDLPELDGFSVNAEQIIALNPDVVFTPPNEGNRDVWNQLDNVGIAVVVLNATTIEDIYRKIDIISQVVGRRSAGEALSGTIRSGLEQVRQTAENSFPDGPISVYVELDSWGGFWTVGGNTFISEIIAIAGGNNIFQAQSGAWVTVSDEQIVAANPFVILYSDWGMSPGIENRAGWGGVYAVVTGEIHGIDANLLSQAGGNVVALANALLEIFLAADCP